jgi:hypothetical protein
MRHAWLFSVALLCALPASGEPIQLTKDMQHALTPIDTIPTVEEIQSVFPQPNTVTQLALIATSNNDDNEFFGLRLRAIRALPLFCPASCAGSLPHQTLVNLLTSIGPMAQTGKSALLLRAVVEALGATKSGQRDDVDLLVRYGLGHRVRDVRAATAFALRDLCNQAAVTPLRDRYNIEMDTGVAQVRFAISEALRDLSTCTP